MSVSGKKSNHFHHHCESKTRKKKALFLPKEKKNATVKDRMCKVWMTVFSNAAVFHPFKLLVYFILIRKKANECFKFSAQENDSGLNL